MTNRIFNECLIKPKCLGCLLNRMASPSIIITYDIKWKNIYLQNASVFTQNTKYGEKKLENQKPIIYITFSEKNILRSSSINIYKIELCMLHQRFVGISPLSLYSWCLYVYVMKEIPLNVGYHISLYLCMKNKVVFYSLIIYLHNTLILTFSTTYQYLMV